MKKKKIAVLLTSLALIGVLAVGATLAYFTDSDERQNVVTLGSVDGILTETGEEVREDGTVGKEYGNVKPGAELEKDPTITMDENSEDAYARIKITYPGLTEQQAAELDTLIQGSLNEGWSKNAQDQCYYYHEKLSAGDTATIFNTVKIPATWGNEMAEKKFQINVVAELIQADNFEWDAASSNGWGQVDIQKLEK